MPSIKDNTLLYIDDESANVKLAFAANEKLCLYAHKQVLSSATNYFDMIFVEESDDTRVAVVIDGKYEFDAFELVLRLIYGFAIDETEWDSFAVDMILDAAVIINDFRFKCVEYKLYTNYEMKPIDDNCFELIYRLLELSIKQELNCMSIIYLRYIDNNAYKVVETLGQYIETRNISPELLVSIFERDSFAVSEIEIFNLINKWFEKNGKSKKGRKRINKYKKSLIKTIRLELITIPELTSIVKPSNIIEDRVINSTIQTLKKGKVKKRFRNYAEASNTIEEFNYEIVSVSKQTFPTRPTKRKFGSSLNNMAIKVAIPLPRPEMINRITFHTFYKDDLHIDAFMHYYVEVKSRSQWHKVCDKSRTDCFANEKQVIDFKTTLLVSHIAIIGINETGNFKIKKLKYKLVPQNLSHLEKSSLKLY